MLQKDDEEKKKKKLGNFCQPVIIHPVYTSHLHLSMLVSWRILHLESRGCLRREFYPAECCQ